MENEQQTGHEFDVHLRQLHWQILSRLGVKTQQDALLVIARLKERSGVLAAVEEHLGVKHHWQVMDTLRGNKDG